MIFDLALIETDGNGGDIQLRGNDLAVVNSIENMPYLAMFGGNVLQSSTADVNVDSKDWWGNKLLMTNDASIQFNSLTERVLNSTALTSGGRITIENAIKKDLEFFAPTSTVTVVVSIIATDRISVNIKIVTPFEGQQLIIINFRKTSTGDWFIEDFNNDFLL